MIRVGFIVLALLKQPRNCCAKLEARWPAHRVQNLHAKEYADRPKLSAEEQSQLDADWLSAGFHHGFSSQEDAVGVCVGGKASDRGPN